MAADLEDKLATVVRQRNERDAILSSMVEGVLAIDGDERLLRMNDAAARLLGSSRPGRKAARCRRSSAASISTSWWPP